MNPGATSAGNGAGCAASCQFFTQVGWPTCLTVPSPPPRHRRDWLSYKKESRLAEGLDDRARFAQLEEMYELFLVFQRAKSPEQLKPEARAERRLNAWNLNPRYRALLAEAHGDEDAR